MYACVCERVYICLARTVCVSGRAREGAACINMPRFGRTVVSLCGLGFRWCGKGAVRAGLVRLGPDLLSGHFINIAGAAQDRRT